MSKKTTPQKPITKESYALPKTPAQTLNCFEVLGKIPRPYVPKPIAYFSKEAKLLLKILENDHISPSGEFDFQKIFQNNKMFLSNDLSKTRKFYEFILVDIDSVQISHIQNQEGTNIAYSKCKILKVIYKKE